MIQFDQDRQDYFNMLPGVKTFQLFHDKKKSLGIPKIFHHPTGDMPLEWIIKLEDLNASGMGVYMTVNETNGQGRKATDVIRVRACFADFDGAPIDPVWDYNPSMVIETSPGKFHVYFVVTDVPLEGFRQVQKAIAYRFKSDEKVHDLPRVARVPGFFHSKGERFMSRIIHRSDSTFSFRDMQEMFPPAPVKQWSAPKYQNQPDFPQDVEFKGNYGTSAGNRNCHISKRIGGMLKRNLPWHVIEHEAMKEAASCCPPLPERETLHILKSLRRYA